MKYDEIIAHFTVKKETSTQYICECPICHKDKLYITKEAKDNHIALYCQHCCNEGSATYEDILDASGLKKADLYLESYSAPIKPKTEYKYTDADGKTIAVKVRSYDENGKKKFLWYYTDSTGKKVYNTKGLQIPLFNLYELSMSADPVLFIVEGEKDVQTMAALKQTATTLPNGGNSKKWEQWFSDAIKDYETIVIITDNDPTGTKYGKFIANNTYQNHKVKIISASVIDVDICQKGDITDIYEENGAEKTIDMLRAAYSKVPYYDPSAKTEEVNDELEAFLQSAYGLTELTEDDYKPPEFFVDDLISIGLTALVGASKVGKSTFITEMCCEIAIGGKLLGHKAHKTGVVYFDLEESKSLIANRIQKQGYGDIPASDLLIFHDLPNGYELNRNFLELIDIIRQKTPQYKVFVVDTIARALAPEKSTGNAYLSDVEIFKAIQRYAIDNNIAIVMLTHDSKGSATTNDVTKKQNGSTGLPATADTTIYICRKDNDRTSNEGIIELTGRLFKSAKEKMVWSDEQTKWKAASEVNDYMLRDPYIAEIVQNAPDVRGAEKIVTYKELHDKATSFTYAQEHSYKIKQIIADNQLEILQKYGVFVIDGAKCKEGRGIRIIKA